MKVYLAGSMSGERKFEMGLKAIAENIRQLNHVIVSPWVLEPAEELTRRRRDSKTAEIFFNRNLSVMAQSDAAVVEVSQPSHVVGYELRLLEELAKPVLCLKLDFLRYQPTSIVVEGRQAFNLRFYNEERVKDVLIDFFDEVRRGKEGGVVSKERQ